MKESFLRLLKILAHPAKVEIFTYLKNIKSIDETILICCTTQRGQLLENSYKSSSLKTSLLLLKLVSFPGVTTGRSFARHGLFEKVNTVVFSGRRFRPLLEFTAQSFMISFSYETKDFVRLCNEFVFSWCSKERAFSESVKIKFLYV